MTDGRKCATCGATKTYLYKNSPVWHKIAEGQYQCHKCYGSRTKNYGVNFEAIKVGDIVRSKKDEHYVVEQKLSREVWLVPTAIVVTAKTPYGFWASRDWFNKAGFSLIGNKAK